MSAVSAGAADLHATVNPEGLASSARFEYLTAAAYDANIAASRDPFFGAATSPANPSPLGSGTDPVAFLRRLGGLKATTAYRWRITASNSSGPAFGPTRTFTTTANAPVFSLPDNRGWEMVSPVDKNGGEIQEPGELYGGGLVQAAEDGQATSYSSRTSFGPASASSTASQYVSRRTGSGWLTENVTVPTLAGAFGDKPDGVPYRLFSGDLSLGLVATPQRCEVGPCLRGYDLRQSANGALAASTKTTDMDFVGASPDLSATVLSTCKALTANAIEVPGVGGCDPAFPNLYRWSGGALTAINLLPAQGTTTPGAELAASLGRGLQRRLPHLLHPGRRPLPAHRQRNGARRLRRRASRPPAPTAPSPSSPKPTSTATTSTASTPRPKPSPTSRPSGGVQGVLGASPDGSHLYYLTASGLYLHRNGAATKVADAADASNYPPATGTARVAANGTLAFLASAALTDFDSNATTQVYRYLPGAGLTCASCNPTGSRPLGRLHDPRRPRQRQPARPPISPEPSPPTATASSSTPATRSSSRTPTTTATSTSGRPREPALAPLPAAASP